MMKKFISLPLVIMLLVPTISPALAVTNPLLGKIISLDAGHGSSVSDTGAVNQKYGVAEADVNLLVVNVLKMKLEGQGAYVVIAARLASRKDRVNDAIAKCAALDITGDGVADNRKCDVLVSIHHNSLSDPAHDGTLVIYNEKQDISLATALHNSLITGLGLTDEGYLNGGYGVTVYGHLVSALTEAYYITNDCETELYLYKTTISPSCNKTIYPDGDRVDREAQLQVNGLSNYFASQTSGGGGKPK